MIEIILLIIAAVFAGFIFLYKREIRSIKGQLKEQISGIQKPIDVSFVDKDITELASQINDIISYQKGKNLEIVKREYQLKESISNVSHDLRTPLTSIIGYLQLLNKTELQTEQKEFVKTVLSRSNELRNLINDFYDVSIWENKESALGLKSINLNNMLADSILAFTEQFEEKAITPKLCLLTEPCSIMADEIMLKRVLNNLISNVIRYGVKELQVTVLKAEYITVEFKNDVVEEQAIEIEKLFDKFYTADVSRSNVATGLGLYIAKLLLEKMGGTVEASLNNQKLRIILSFIKEIP